MAAFEWGTREWQNAQFPKHELDSTGDAWGIRWRGMEKMRHASYLKLVADDLEGTEPLSVLDIGCALCDFTQKAWKLNPQNKFFGIDTSENAIAWVTENFPEFDFKVGILPDIPFDNEFDVVFCLEVLCYLNADDRTKSIENIRDVLAPSGKLVFSGVLDGGQMHHTHEEVFGLLGDDFDVRKVRYNHWILHRKLVENPMTFLQNGFAALIHVFEMSDDDAKRWRSSKGTGRKYDVPMMLRRLNPVSIWLSRLIARSARFIRSSRLLAEFGHWISKHLRGDTKADEIVVVAVKK